ncbi:uncharacterized protein TNCV_1360101 [Trichonephila clavipes]|nr:uncharacterized protein TNCV_1360101 [Trichonephila clavipes]
MTLVAVSDSVGLQSSNSFVIRYLKEMATRGCVNSPNCFCYICGSYTVKKQQRNISNFVQKVYFVYFGIKLGEQDKSWAPHVVCSVSVEELRQWFKGKKKSFRFAVPMIWREPKNHSDDCYFCSCSVQGFNLKNRRGISYPTIIRSAIRLVPHGLDLPIPLPPDTLDNILDDLDQISILMMATIHVQMTLNFSLNQI